MKNLPYKDNIYSLSRMIHCLIPTDVRHAGVSKRPFTGLIFAFLLLNLLFIAGTSTGEEETTPQERFQKNNHPGTWSPERFLQVVRRPITANGWAQFEGYMVHKDKTSTRRKDLKIAATFNPRHVRAKIVFPKGGGYWINQTYKGQRAGAENTVETDIKETDDPAPEVSLDSLKLRAQDITFSFLRWKFLKEHEPKTYRGLACRVMDVSSPDKKATARLWVSRKYLFPVKVVWFKTKNAQTRLRRMEFTEFKKHSEYWFVKTVKYYGKDWRSKLVLEHAVIRRAEEQPPPEKLFEKIAPRDHLKNPSPETRR